MILSRQGSFKNYDGHSARSIGISNRISGNGITIIINPSKIDVFVALTENRWDINASEDTIGSVNDLSSIRLQAILFSDAIIFCKTNE